MAKTKPKADLMVLLTKSTESIATVLPVADGSRRKDLAERLVKVARMAIYRTPRLTQCDPATVMEAIMQCARLGLEIGLEAHLVPFYNGRTKTYECQMIPDYKGIAKLVYHATNIRLDARVVFANDSFAVEYGTAPSVVHRPALKDAGPMRAVYAVAHFPDGGQPKFEVMTKEEVDAIRSRSRAKDDGPWKTDYNEMAKKTVVKRLCKLLPLTADAALVVQQDNVFEGTGEPLPTDEDGTVDAVASATQQQLASLRDELEEQQDEAPVEASA